MQQFSLSTVLLISIFVIGALTSVFLLSQGLDEENLRVLIRWTARSAATLFMIIFGLSSVRYVFKDRLSTLLLPYRPHLGLVFGTIHIYHLLFLVALQQTVHPVFTLAKTTSLIGGGIAYGLLLAMMVTTFPRFKARLSIRQWKTLHLIGGYWLWILFFRSYTRKAFVFGEWEGYLLFIPLLVVLALRLWRHYKESKWATISPEN